MLPRQAKLVIVPLSDIHADAPTHDTERFDEAIDWIARSAAREDRVIATFIMGDTLDMLSTSERRALASAGFHESTRASIEKMMWEKLKEFEGRIAKAKHTVCAVVSGNHSFIFQDANVSGPDCGKTIDQVLAEHLGVPYLGMFGIFILQLRESANSSALFPLKMYLHHGSGGAAKKPSSLANMLTAKDDWPACHIYIMGHNHVPVVGLSQWNDVRCNQKTGLWRHVQYDQAFVRAPSFLKGVVEGMMIDARGGNYAEERRFSNQRTGVTTANVRWKLAKNPAHKRNNSHPDGVTIRVQE